MAMTERGGRNAARRALGFAALPARDVSERRHWLGLDRVRFYSMTMLVCSGVFGGIFLIRSLFDLGSHMAPPAMEFLPMWSAARLATHGRALDAWQYALLFPIQKAAVPSVELSHGMLFWLYPPNALLMILPLGWLPYALAACTWVGLGAFAFVRAVRAIVPDRTAMLCAIAFPGACFTIFVGQSSLMTAALAGFGLALLPRRPVLAGICMGLVAFKPQVAVLFPLALLASARWRALLAWGLTIAVSVMLSAWAFGPAAWVAFANGANGAVHVVGAGQALLARMPTFFAAATLAGLPNAVAAGLQVASAALACAAVVYAWRGDAAYPLRAAVLACASLLVSPYLYDYDLAWLGILIAWYVRHSLAHGWRRFEREWLVVLWLTPITGLLVVIPLQFQFLPFVTLGTLAMLISRIAAERHGKPYLPADPDAPLAIDRLPASVDAHAARRTGTARSPGHEY